MMADLPGERGVQELLVHLDLKEMPPVALRTFNPDLDSLLHARFVLDGPSQRLRRLPPISPNCYDQFAFGLESPPFEGPQAASLNSFSFRPRQPLPRR